MSFFLFLHLQIHRAGLLWCERAAPSLLLAGEPDRDYSASGDGRRGSLWRDCLTIVRNLTLLNGNHGVGSGASTGGMTRSVSADSQGDGSTGGVGGGLPSSRDVWSERPGGYERRDARSRSASDFLNPDLDGPKVEKYLCRDLGVCASSVKAFRSIHGICNAVSR